jgi:alpha-tubulin suppressor-like RCC1 family protein
MLVLVALAAIKGSLLDPFDSRALTVTNVAAGGEQTLYLKSDGSLWSTGYRWQRHPDGSGQGIGSSTPQQIASNYVVACAAGIGHCFFIKSDRSLWGLGWNQFGELGDGGANLYYYYTPRQIASDVIAAAAGNGHGLFVKTNGSLWAMGYNADGELGDGTTNNSYVPEQIMQSGVVAVAAGLSHSLFLKSDGSVWVMGANAYGQLGDGTVSNSFVPKQIVGSNVVAISAGEYHSLFLNTDGSLWATGYNEFGQLGDGTTTNRCAPKQILSNGVTAVIGGRVHSLFLKTDASLWGMGYAHLGQLGDGATSFSVTVPERILPNGATAIACGSYHSLFLKTDGTLWGMGNDYDGELGCGPVRGIRVFPVLVSPRVSFSAAPIVGVAPLNVQFISPSTDSEGNALATWNWNFGDSSSSDIHNPPHVYVPTNSGYLTTSPVFAPTLAVTNINGLAVSASGPSIVLAVYSGLVLNGGFETGDFFGWTTNAATSGYYQRTGASLSGKYGAQLNFPKGYLLALSQMLATSPDTRYFVSFWFRNLSAESIATNNVLRVLWDGNLIIDKTNPVPGSLLWTNYQFIVAATRTNTVLQFQFRNDSGYSSINLDAIAVLPQPVIGGLSFSGSDIVLTASNGLSGLTCYVMTSTNLAWPLNQWTKVATRILDGNGDFSMIASNAVNSNVPNRYYILRLSSQPLATQNLR